VAVILAAIAFITYLLWNVLSNYPATESEGFNRSSAFVDRTPHQWLPQPALTVAGMVVTNKSLRDMSDDELRAFLSSAGALDRYFVLEEIFRRHKRIISESRRGRTTCFGVGVLEILVAIILVAIIALLVWR
jgi:hypothetical protein